MTRSKKIGIILASLVIFIVLLGLLLPKTYEATIVKKVEAPFSFGFNYTYDLQHLPEWFDSQSKPTITYSEVGVRTTGNGLTLDYKVITDSTDGVFTLYNSKLNDSIHLQDNNLGKNTTEYFFTFKGITDKQSEIALTAIKESGYFKNLLNLWYSHKLKKELEPKLNNIVAKTEERYNKKIYNGYLVEEIEMGQKFYIFNRNQVSFDDVNQFFTQNVTSLYHLLVSKNIKVTSPPTVLYFNTDPTRRISDIGAAIGTLMQITDIPNVQSMTVLPKKALRVQHQGDLKLMFVAHLAITEYMGDHNLLPDMPVIEEHVTNPSVQPDMTKWITNVIYYYTPKQ